MKYLTSIAGALALALCTTAASAQAPVAIPVSRDPAGDWHATLAMGTVKLRLALHLGAKSSFDSPDQGANGLPAQMSVAADGTVTVLLTGAGEFVGRLSADGRTLAGELKQGAGVPITFERGAFAQLNRPQTPKPPFAYKAEDVGYDNPAQPGVHLAGTLTIPEGKGPFPAVLLITGSGAQDRDETLFEHKPFLVLADALTRRGIAVLRVDDRGMGGSRGPLLTATSADLATDVEAGVAWLRKRPEIDPKRVGLLGHSEGGLIGPLAASRDPSIAFVVMWAGSGVSGKDVVVDQVLQLALNGGATVEIAQHNASLQRALLDALIAAPDRNAAGIAMNAVASANGGPPISEATITQMTVPWYLHFLKLDPAVALRKLNMPVLALLGSKDLQVTPALNEAPLRAALKANNKANVEVLPGLNHLFQLAKTGGPEEYGAIEQTIDPSALNRMIDWIAGVTGTARTQR